MWRGIAPLLACLLLGAAAALAEPPCGGDFGAWLDGVRAEARAAGISDTTIAALDGLTPNAQVLARDHAQAVFTQDWLTFAGRMVNAYRLRVGAEKLTRYADVFAAAERDTGVPAPVIAAFWGLETDYGAVQGDFDTLAALATLAHDCRRPDLFRAQLIDALRLLDLGWLTRAQLKGAWAGEIGQVQLLPTDYLDFGADGDGDGRVDLEHDPADVIPTAAGFIRHLGWRRGEPWLEAVRVPAELPWEQADVYRRYPSSHWAALGVTRANGSPLPANGLDAALLLPTGRKGPAFLAYLNFDVFLHWNQSLVYSTTAAYLATRLGGAPKVDPGNPEPGLNPADMAALQHRLAERGYDIGDTDGILGEKTRAAVRAEQQRLGLPADGWPTPELLARLR
ncbi:MAG: lytic murein transglycosylase [Thiohalocapsa sp.]|uniref:lytic murein transglycosylase n=1 Tax=Thiohalocapsa sp. TaxID=2497641 RepID=UPI0025F56A7C|nr:lytic murein transglycosylase [Thiohalocapsa sp.]MCG6939731.1 lytic murein transglycosylase [Thiohalocapsa sp.]